jgi:fermentation-respiration switch protein FrsA (DUF1100 family)
MPLMTFFRNTKPRGRQRLAVWKFRLLAVCALGIVSVVTASWYMGGALSAPTNHSVGPPPASLMASTVAFPSESGSTIRGWMSRGDAGRGAVLLLHGVRSDRRSMVSRAIFLHEIGYSVLLIDLQAHGESAGERITLGHLESRDVVAAREFLRRALPAERVAVIGVSLGAAAVVLGEGRAEFAAAILESMYPSISEAVADRLRMRFGIAGTWLAPLLTLQLQPRLGIDADQLRPVDRIRSLNAPLLLIHGTRDRHTLIDEARAVFAMAGNPKQFWEVEGAAHVDLHSYAGKEYERRIEEFLAQHLPHPNANK